MRCSWKAQPMGASIKICYVMLCYAHLILTCACASHFDLRVRISFWPARAHLILTCPCGSHFCLRMHTSFRSAHAHLIYTWSCAFHFGLRVRIFFWPAHAHLTLTCDAHLILTCPCASHFCLRMHTSFRWYLISTPHLNGISLAHLGRQSLLKWGHLIWPPVGPATLRTRKTLNDWTRGQLLRHTSLFQVATLT